MFSSFSLSQHCQLESSMYRFFHLFLTVIIASSLFTVNLLVFAKEPAVEGKYFGAKETEYPSWFKESFLDFKEDIEEAKGQNKRLILLFYQNGCPYCNALVERNLSQKNIQQKMRQNFEVIAINMWGDRELTDLDGKTYTEKTFSEKMRVQFTPTLLFFDESGNKVLRLNGYRSPDRFSVDLDYVIGKNESKIKYRDFVQANFKPGSSSSKMHPQEFFLPPPYNLSKKNGRPKAVFFEQKDCPNCDNLHSKVLTDKETRKLIKQFDVIQLDMWSRQELVTPSGKSTSARQWAKDLDIQFAPSIVVFNQDGLEVIRLEAFFKLFHTQSIFDYVYSGAYKNQPSFQRYLSDRADKIREEGKDIDIWRYADELPGERR